MAKAAKVRGARSPKEQVYFSGQVHEPLPGPKAAKFSKKIAARFKGATPIAEPQIILWSDASRRVNNSTSGISTICNICLPIKPKYTIEEARYIDYEKNNNILALELDVTLNLYWCPRNVTEQLDQADSLAAEARRTRKMSYEWKCGDDKIGRVRDYIKPHATLEDMGSYGIMPEQAGQGPTGEEKKHSMQTRRRKTPAGNVVEEEAEDSPEAAQDPPRKKGRYKLRSRPGKPPAGKVVQEEINVSSEEKEESKNEELDTIAVTEASVTEGNQVRTPDNAQGQPVEPAITAGHDEAGDQPTNEAEGEDVGTRQDTMDQRELTEYLNIHSKISFRWRLGNTKLHIPGQPKGYDGIDIIDCYFIFGRLGLEEFLWRKQEGVIADGQCLYTLWQAF
ncbi:hypothetical protein VPNG_03866 [Cytospora leucostoma]|uniref:Uncharacterized protein n=1 Tax=Cytospora leucostoma TaxID=1230097 RepID=A0A423XEB4_9PEZI|nr:hypothetical protein VPNG_03866 [Cytospora leucostoma]